VEARNTSSGGSGDSIRSESEASSKGNVGHHRRGSAKTGASRGPAGPAPSRGGGFSCTTRNSCEPPGGPAPLVDDVELSPRAQPVDTSKKGAHLG